MTTATATPPRKSKSRTRIVFDLSDELTADQIAAFEAKAREAGAKDLTEHFLNITIRETPKSSN